MIVPADCSNNSLWIKKCTKCGISDPSVVAATASNTTDVTDKSEYNASDSDEKTDSGSASDKTVQTDSDNSSISVGGLPVLTEEISKASDNSESECKPSETETQTTASEQENGGVIELPMILVK
ncbi:MAG: hypothetical protein ACI4JN_11415 [Ruminococcus sp.]